MEEKEESNYPSDTSTLMALFKSSSPSLLMALSKSSTASKVTYLRNQITKIKTLEIWNRRKQKSRREEAQIRIPIAAGLLCVVERNEFNLAFALEEVLYVFWAEFIVEVANVCNVRGLGGDGELGPGRTFRAWGSVMKC